MYLCAVRSDNPQVKEYADKLYQQLLSNRVEVIYDDRQVTAGVMFSDADLLGVPLRVIVSPRNMKESCCEIAARDKSFSMKVPLDDACEKIADTIQSMLKELNADYIDK